MEMTLQGVTAIITIGIMLSVGVVIFGELDGAFDCENLVPAGTAIVNNNYTDNTWAHTCHEIQEQEQSAMALIIIVLIIISAVVILSVVRMLG